MGRARSQENAIIIDAPRPLQPVLGAAAERLKHAWGGASTKRWEHARRAADSYAETTLTLIPPRLLKPNEEASCAEGLTALCP